MRAAAELTRRGGGAGGEEEKRGRRQRTTSSRGQSRPASRRDAARRCGARRGLRPRSRARRARRRRARASRRRCARARGDCRTGETTTVTSLFSFCEGEGQIFVSHSVTETDGSYAVHTSSERTLGETTGRKVLSGRWREDILARRTLASTHVLAAYPPREMPTTSPSPTLHSEWSSSVLPACHHPRRRRRTSSEMPPGLGAPLARSSLSCRRTCTARMSRRPRASGSSTRTMRSKRPGRTSAGSRISYLPGTTTTTTTKEKRRKRAEDTTRKTRADPARAGASASMRGAERRRGGREEE